MKTEQLKAKILDLLIKGELTTKWRESHKDIENAEVLLEKIRSEKEKKLNDELIAKGKKPTAKVEIKEVADNDKPFEIPTSWKWCHVGDVFAHNTGKTLNKGEAKEGELLDYITTSNLYWWRFDFTKVKQMLFKQNEIEKYSVRKGDLLVCEGGDVGRTAIWENDYSVCYQNHIHRLRPHIQGINVYFFSYIFFVYKLAGKFDSTAKGIGIKGLASNALDSMIIPLPPLEEQQELARIAQILLTMVYEVDSSYTNLEDLSKKAKAKVLDLLIKGELTTKWRESHKDIENAEILLEKIRCEKEKKLNDELIAKGKKPTAKVEIKEVADNDKPFEIPTSWKWCRLGDLAEIITDGTHKTPEYVDEGVPFLSIQNISKGYFDFTKLKHITQQEHEQLIKRVYPKKGDILFCRIGTLGRAIEVNLDFEFSIFVSLGYIKLMNQELNRFIIDLINSPYGISWFQENKVGDGTHAAKLNLGDMPKFLIPLPPLEEQKELSRIAEILLNQIDSLIDKKSTQNGVEENE